MKLSQLFVLLSLVYIACNKPPSSTDTQQTSDVLTVNAISLDHGPANTIVVISGTGFSPINSLNTVFFNGQPAIVISATATTITVKVPVGAGTGNTSVKVGSTLINGPVFTYELSLMATVIAGSGYAGTADGIGTAASFGTPTGLTLDNTGNIYVADMGANTIRKITPSGVVTTLAGTPLRQGNANGIGTSASFHIPNDVAVDAFGNVFVADYENSSIRKITPAGTVTTFVTDMVNPTGITIGSDGYIYVVSPFLDEVRKVATNGTWTTVGSNLYNPFDVAIDGSGNLYIADSQGQTINKISPAGLVTQIAGTFGMKGFNNGLASSAILNTPKSIAIDNNGNIYVADVGNNAIRKITSGGLVSTYLDDVSSYTTDANYFGPYGVSVDKNGVVYFTNTSENKILKIIMQ
jgi:streptogramin lyase